MRAVKGQRERERERERCMLITALSLSLSQSYGLFLRAQGQIIDSVTRINQGSLVAGTGNDS